MVDWPEWRERAACRFITDLEMFFPDRSAREFSEKAIEVCKQCAVRQECLTYAIKHEIYSGVWGGTTPRERFKSIKRRYHQ